jgi:hypothetical protein
MAIGDLSLIGQRLYIEVEGGTVTIGNYVKTAFAPGNVSNITQIIVTRNTPVLIQLSCNIVLPAVSLVKV